METRNRGIYRKVRLLKLWVIFVIMKVIKSYNTLNDYYRKLFGEKTFKVPIDAGFDCPNRDGTVAHGGCTFCTVSGSGDAIVAPDAPIREQFYKEIDFIHRKWPDVQKYL
ncbi:TPA: Fe-S oxidoreductase, partial [Streptococcus pneumoniae]